MKKCDYSKLWMRIARQGIRDRDLARLAKISTATVSRMRKGRPISSSTIYQISAALDCPVDWIGGYEDPADRIQSTK